MSEADRQLPSNLLELTAQIVSAHVRSNIVPAAALPGLVLGVRHALASAGLPQAPVPTAQHQQPAVPVKRSIQPDYLVCLEDGAKVTMLKRYLQGRFGLTPDAYRAKWGLPADYPMVAPNYATRRSNLAKALGLGRKRLPARAADTDDGGDDQALRGVDAVEEPVCDTAAEPVFASDLADAARAGRHTVESVFGDFGNGNGISAEEQAGEVAPASDATAPRKRGGRPFAEQSVRSGRGRRAPSET